MSAYAGISGDVWLSTSPPTALSSPETANDSGDHIHYFMATHQAWDWTKTLTIQCSPNGSTGWATVVDYTFYWPVGEIVFNTARTVGTNNFVRVSAGSYFTLSQLSGAHAWKAQAKANTKDCTPFQASGSFATYTATTKQMTFSVDVYSQDARILTEMIKSGVGVTNTSGGIIVCQLWWNVAGGKRYQFFGLPTGVDTTVAANDIDKQSVKMSADGPVYEVLSNTFNTTNVKQM
jgi:hypothetical protein